MPDVIMKIDASGGTDPGQTKLTVESPETYVPPTYTRCRELEATNTFFVELTNAAAIAKYGDYRSTLNSMLNSIWTELNEEITEGGICEDIGGVFLSSGGTTRTGTPSTVKASGSFSFSTCFEPYDCLNDPENLLGDSSLKCRVEIPGPSGFNVKAAVAAVNPAANPGFPPAGLTAQAALKAAVAAHPTGVAEYDAISGSYVLNTSAGIIRVSSGSFQLTPTLSAFGITGIYSFSPPLGAQTDTTGTWNSIPQTWPVFPSSISLTWVAGTPIFDEISVPLTTTGGAFPHIYTISGGPTFGVFDTSGVGTISAGQRMPVLRHPGSPRGCPFHWTYFNVTPFGWCETRFQLFVDENHVDNVKRKAPCECTIVVTQEES